MTHTKEWTQTEVPQTEKSPTYPKKIRASFLNSYVPKIITEIGYDLTVSGETFNTNKFLVKARTGFVTFEFLVTVTHTAQHHDPLFSAKVTPWSIVVKRYGDCFKVKLLDIYISKTIADGEVRLPITDPDFPARCRVHVKRYDPASASLESLEVSRVKTSLPARLDRFKRWFKLAWFFHTANKTKQDSD